MVLNEGIHVIDKWTSVNYLQYVHIMWGLGTPSMLRADYPTLFTWMGGMFVQAQDQQVTTRCPRIVT